MKTDQLQPVEYFKNYIYDNFIEGTPNKSNLYANQTGSSRFMPTNKLKEKTDLENLLFYLKRSRYQKNLEDIWKKYLVKIPTFLWQGGILAISNKLMKKLSEVVLTSDQQL